MPSSSFFKMRFKIMFRSHQCLVLCLLSVALLSVTLCGCPGKVTPPDVPKPPEKDIAQLAQLRNLGLAYVENEELVKSHETFTQLAKLLPEELMPIRNLAVSATLATEKVNHNEPEELKTVTQEFTTTIEKLKEKDPSENPNLLSAQGYVHLQQNDAAIEELKVAVKKNPENAAAWFQLFTLADMSRDAEIRKSGQEALQHAFELEPSNVFVMFQWLLVQSQNEDVAIVETLANSGELIEQLAPGIKIRTGYDIREFANAALLAAKENQWKVVRTQINYLWNASKSDDAAQSDRRDLVRHPLDYLINAFPTEIEDEITSAQAKDHSSVEVTFADSYLGLKGNLPVHAAKFADIDLDTRVEIVLLQQELLSVLSNGDWKQVASTIVPEGLTQIAICDLENDADTKLIPEGQENEVCHTTDLEIVAYGASGIALYQANLSLIGGDIALVPFELKGELVNLKGIQKISVSDLNNDGDLDLLVICDELISMWSNRGDLLFEKFAPTWEVPETVSDCVAIDYDHDVDTDVLVLLKSGRFGYLENLRHGTFRWKTLDMTATSIHPEVINITDYNHDGDWDFLLAGNETSAADGKEQDVSKKGIVLTKSESSSGTEISIGASGIQGRGKSLEVIDWDFDNDGLRDLVYVSSESVEIQRQALQEKKSDGFSVKPSGTGELFVGCDVGDIDADGDDDLLCVSNQKLMLRTNNGGNQNHWIDVELLAKQLARGEASASGRVNMYGLGSVVEVRSGVSYQKQRVTRERTRFGLGKHQQADAIRVLWTNGVPANILQPEVNQLVCERQSLKGSCPYLYTWNGSEFVFVTDLLWASPIGLKDANGQLVPARNWEYLKVPGEMLVARDGEYQLQVTEELWEVAYFDQCELIAIDHPPESEIYSNEKVGPPGIAEFKIHTVENKRHPVSVVNQSGADLLPLVINADDNYAKAFDTKLYQGYTTDSWLEIDLGLTEKPENLKLYLTGWIYPTDTSINAALHENPTLSGPRPPSISVVNKQGEFVEVIPFTGFPGGKTKTIVLELSDLFLTEDYRLRLSTSSELYLDEIFFTIQEESSNTPASQIVQTPLSLLSANLHNRGVSSHVDHPNFGPERFLYNELESLPPWPPISGNFTRYGDVFPLISEADDRMVIMGTGDEMTLTFGVPAEPLKSGWKRDFILHNIGWDKDADLHTVYGTTVEPLPFRAMKHYPYTPEDVFPDSSQNEKYHTRTMHPHRYQNSLKHLMRQ